MRKFLSSMIFAVLFLFASNISQCATPSKLGLTKYALISPMEMKDLEEYVNKKVSIEMIYGETVLSNELLTPDQKGYHYTPSTNYEVDWIKEAFPRDDFMILRHAVPIVAFKKAKIALESIKKGEKITLMGIIKRKALKYKIKREFLYFDVESVNVEQVSSSSAKDK